MTHQPPNVITAQLKALNESLPQHESNLVTQLEEENCGSDMNIDWQA